MGKNKEKKEGEEEKEVEVARRRRRGRVKVRADLYEVFWFLQTQLENSIGKDNYNMHVKIARRDR